MVPRLLYQVLPGEVIDLDLDGIDDGPLPQPCATCGRPASPYLDTAHGRLCFACADSPGAPTDPGARAAWRNAQLDRTFHRLVAARVARELAPALAPACRG
jgi:hypothetical protein